MRSALRISLLLLLALGIAAGSLYVLHLDREIRERFAGVRWAVPSKVFAAPMELYPGLDIGPDALADELDRLGYRKVGEARNPGTYARSGSSVQLVSRPFRYWDGEVPSRRLFIRFGGGGIREIVEPGVNSSHALVRIDPLAIGSIHAARAEDRLLLKRDEVPELLARGVILVEDRHFYKHHGVSIRGIGRALVANIRAGRVVQGGSTITQQLVRNFFLTLDQNLQRKIKEAVMALLLELHYDKEAILEAYINEIFLGQDGSRAVHGFGLASVFYFNKPVAELNAAETALLVSLAKGASYYNPRRHPERARERRDLVLGIFADNGLIDEATHEAAVASPLGVASGDGVGAVRYPAFIELVRRQLQADYREEDLQSEGLRVFTTLVPRAQAGLERSIGGGLDEIERGRGMEADTLEAAGIVARTESGEIIALAGGRDGRYRGFNRALDARRPIGSLAKPFVYHTALSAPERFNLLSMLEDEPLRIEMPNGSIWEPRNYDADAVHGDVRLYEALAKSYNLATARLGLAVTPEAVADTMRRAGLEEAPAALPSLALGAVDLSPLQVAQMYATLASGGYRYPLTAIREVTDAEGAPLTRYGLRVERGLDEGPTFLTNWALERVTLFGTGQGVYRRLDPGTRIAGKTGTTDGFRDAWFAGFGSDRVGVIWVGRDDNKPTGLTGASGALPLWSATMERIGLRSYEPYVPESVAEVQVDRESGMLAGEGCTQVIVVPYIAEFAPGDKAPCADEGDAGGIRGWFERLWQ
ncbi:penicillin-binding protein 1B [Algiphilus sp.]|uniref:penicillin-binding protein 1B n=1 Tax=Algiphilus sp. TaxID=1872431 RepID=UPI0025C3BE4A|nr:penicillin-binding protein 1B [Algiphilus sp.]MCK5770798.1 penicillin-binding protein 1B [Algiphilus sp.]